MSKYNTSDPEAVEIRKKIEMLQSKNPAIKLYDVISKEDVELFEYVNGVILPEDYEWFITNVGNGGTWRDGEYHFFPLDLDDADFYFEGVQHFQYGRDTYSIPVFYAGCTYSFGLILKGEHFGEISYNDMDMHMAYYEEKLPHSFKEFYLNWLEEACQEFGIEF